MSELSEMSVSLFLEFSESFFSAKNFEYLSFHFFDFRKMVLSSNPPYHHSLSTIMTSECPPFF